MAERKRRRRRRKKLVDWSECDHARVHQERCFNYDNPAKGRPVRAYHTRCIDCHSERFIVETKNTRKELQWVRPRDREEK